MQREKPELFWVVLSSSHFCRAHPTPRPRLVIRFARGRGAEGGADGRRGKFKLIIPPPFGATASDFCWMERSTNGEGVNEMMTGAYPSSPRGIPYLSFRFLNKKYLDHGSISYVMNFPWMNVHGVGGAESFLHFACARDIHRLVKCKSYSYVRWEMARITFCVTIIVDGFISSSHRL